MHELKTPVRVAVRGFGRIGRRFTRCAIGNPFIQIVAIQDLADIHTMAHLFQYDSIHGKWKGTLEHNQNEIVINQHRIPYIGYSVANHDLPWKILDVDIVIEATGQYKTSDNLQGHIHSGAKRVILSAPPEDEKIPVVVLGVNDHVLENDFPIVSNASCTTNNAAPMIKILDDALGIESCYITTVHSYTGDQRIHDAPHKDLRRSRAAAQSIIPTSTGAAKALTRIFPHLATQMGGCGIRVPVPDGSLTDITATVRHTSTLQDINNLFKAYSSLYPEILEYTSDPIVSSDIVGSAASCIFDSSLTSVIGSMVKVVGWYDNETGYSNRLCDLVMKIGMRLQS